MTVMRSVQHSSFVCSQPTNPVVYLVLANPGFSFQLNGRPEMIIHSFWDAAPICRGMVGRRTGEILHLLIMRTVEGHWNACSASAGFLLLSHSVVKNQGILNHAAQERNVGFFSPSKLEHGHVFSIHVIIVAFILSIYEKVIFLLNI